MNRVTNKNDVNLEFDYLDVDYSDIRNRKLEEEKRKKEILLTDTLELNLEELKDYE